MVQYAKVNWNILEKTLTWNAIKVTLRAKMVKKIAHLVLAYWNNRWDDLKHAIINTKHAKPREDDY